MVEVARWSISTVGAQRMNQEIKIILIAVSATVAALLVHRSFEQAQASAQPFVGSKLPEVADAISPFPW